MHLKWYSKAKDFTAQIKGITMAKTKYQTNYEKYYKLPHRINVIGTKAGQTNKDYICYKNKKYDIVLDYYNLQYKCGNKFVGWKLFDLKWYQKILNKIVTKKYRKVVTVKDLMREWGETNMEELYNMVKKWSTVKELKASMIQ
jgi:hypothetical protein